MATHVGTTGSITATETSDRFTMLSLTSWTLDLNQETVDSTGFSPTGNMRTRLAGLSSSSGSCSGFLDDTTPIDVTVLFETPGTAIAFVMNTATTGIQYSGSGYITSFSTTATVGEMVTFNCTFDISGQITET
jgi:predicted secreted protein